VSDAFGTIKLIGVDGTVRVLTTDMNGHEVALRWSPDDRHLLVVSGNQAWIMTP
jgi:Tol biopolymer transport system component